MRRRAAWRGLRARLPAHDTLLLAEAVRSRVRGGLLIIDDLQYADPATLAVLPHLAAYCRVAVALRTPHRLPPGTEAALRDAAGAWFDVAPLDRATALAVARRAAPHLDDSVLTTVVDRAGGSPLAVTALARHAGAGRAAGTGDVDQVAYAIVAALADLPRPARTALAALGLLGRPAEAALLGAGVAALSAAGLITADPDGRLAAVSPYTAELAAGLLDAEARTDLHRRLAELTEPAQAARHLAAAGDHRGAYRRALLAADHARGGERATLLLFACGLPVAVDARVRLAAADAALTAGRPHAAAQVLDTATPLGVEADVLRGEAHLQAGDPVAARAAVRPVPDAAAAAVVAIRDRVLLLADLATDPGVAADTADKVAARYPCAPAPVAAALAAVRAAQRAPGWDAGLAAAAASGDPLTARWSAWLLVEHLAADGRLGEAHTAAHTAAAACGRDLAYSWQTRFLAAAHWAAALHGTWAVDAHQLGAHEPPPHRPDPTRPAPHGPDPTRPAPSGPGRPDDDVHRRAADLTDLALPATARGYATAAAALIEADTGLLAAARARLDGAHQRSAPGLGVETVEDHPAVAWVVRETAWLDGQPGQAVAPPAPGGPPLLAGLHHITARWAAYDASAPPPLGDLPGDLPLPARRTLTAWATGTGFPAAADSWAGTAVREQVRCLLAAGVLDDDAGRAVPALLAAEDLATRAGLTVLAGRARRALRRHHVRRDTRSARSGTELTARERDVLRLVAAGEPTRRIAGQLGISAETVDTHVRAGMRKLGARTRTEAAALAQGDLR